MVFSFIIPVYNCAAFVEKAVTSITAQQRSDAEILLINDGSKDNSLEICQRLAETHSNIKVFSQRNRGASAARNVGLDNARGEYVWFVDADDSVLPVIAEVAQLLQETRCDAAVFNYERKTSTCTTPVNEIAERKNLKTSDYLLKNHRLFLWNKVYRREKIGNIRFLDGTKNIEDLLFNIEFLSSIDEILEVPLCTYQYNDENSQSTSRSKSKRNLIKIKQDSFTIHERISFLMAKCENEEKRHAISNLINITISGHFFSLFVFYNYKHVKKAIAWYKDKGLFPIGKTNNPKANFFITMVNNAILRRVLAVVMYIKHHK